jgi:hypothetical protein
MAKTTTNQYQPTATTETATDDALSVAIGRDTAYGINNYKFHAGNHKIISELWNPTVDSLDNAELNLILYLGKWFIPEGLRQVRWWLTTKRTVDVAGENAWTLACSPDFYKGPEIFDSSVLGDYKSDIITNDGAFDVWERKNSALSLCRPDFNGYRWFYLLCENDSGGDDITNRSSILALDVQPLVT